MKREFVDRIREADLILIGIGNEFEIRQFCCNPRATESLQILKEILNGKNYYVVTVCTNSILSEAGFPNDRIVSPCGNLMLKQCPKHCEGSLMELSADEKKLLKIIDEKGLSLQLGECPVCGEAMVLNNIYAEEYDEAGYLDAWKMYTKWLQGTLNKKLCVLELGVDMTFPNIIRWPFEKVAFYNMKASFIRVNQTLYHLSEELKDKGIAVKQNAIDWLLETDI